MICVLTGDIVRSTQLGGRKLDELMKNLIRGAEEVRRWTKPASPSLERFRGDGWQLALLEPRYALRAALVLRAIVRKVDRSADSRIGFGFGTGEFASSLGDSRGPAFEHSGQQLETLKGPDRWSIKGDFAHEQSLLLIQGLFAACEALSRGWTSKQAEVFARLAIPDEPIYATVAEALGVRPQTVQDHFSNAGGRALLKAIHCFEAAID